MESSSDVFADLNDPTLAEYRVAGAIDIAALLNRMRASQSRLSIYFDGQPGTAIAGILEASGKDGRFSFDVDHAAEHALAIAGTRTLAWRAQDAGVRIEFVTAAPRPIHINEQLAFETALPDSVLRLQRRNAFRASTPLVHPLVALLDPDGRGRAAIKARVSDISMLGLSLVIDAEHAPLITGGRVARCSVQLPGYGEVRSALDIRYVLSGGAGQRRCGAQFHGLAAADSVLISRYIQDLQRDVSRMKPPGRQAV